MDFLIPEEIGAVAGAIVRFIEREVVPIEEANRELLSSERNIFTPEGRYTDEMLALRRKVRMRSAELGQGHRRQDRMRKRHFQRNQGCAISNRCRR